MIEPTTWRANAACRKFDPQAWETPNNDKMTALNAEAVEICQTCPVRVTCLAEAMESERGWGMGHRWHIWGGTTPQERAKLDETPRRVARKSSAA